MRVSVLVMAMLLIGAPRLAAQSALAASMDPRLVVAPVRMASPAPVYARRDHLGGAMQGLAMGAVVGGLGFAAVTSMGNSRNGEGYALLAIPVGAVVGGAVGFVAGAVIGLPERDRDGARVLMVSDAAHGLTATVSVPVATPR